MTTQDGDEDEEDEWKATEKKQEAEK